MEGLAFQGNWDAKIQEAQRNEELDQQARITAENKAQLLGDKFKQAHAHNTYDNLQLKALSEQKIKDIGGWILQNRDFERNPAKWAQFISKTDELTNNDIVDRSMRYDTHRQALTKFIADNPDAVNDPDIQRQLKESENYAKVGSTDGVVGGGKEFMFSDPDINFDPNAVIFNGFKQLAYVERKVGNDLIKEVPAEAQMTQAKAILNGPDGRKMMKTWDEMSDSDKGIYQTPEMWIIDIGKGAIGKDITKGPQYSPLEYEQARALKQKTDAYKLHPEFNPDNGNPWVKETTVQAAPPHPYDQFVKDVKPGVPTHINVNGLNAVLGNSGKLTVNTFYRMVNGQLTVSQSTDNITAISQVATGNYIKTTGGLTLMETKAEVVPTESMVDDGFLTKDTYDAVKNTAKTIPIIGWQRFIFNNGVIAAYNKASGDKNYDDTNPTATTDNAEPVTEEEKAIQSRCDALKPGESFTYNGTIYTKPK